MPVADPRQDAIIFAGGLEGYGYAITPADKPPGSTYHWSFNWDCRFPGRAVPSSGPIRITATSTGPGPITSAFEWEEDSGAGQVAGRPIILGTGGTSGSIGGAIAWRLRDGVWVNELAVSSGNRFTGGVLYRYDETGPNADTEMVFYCNGTANDFLYRRKKDGTIDQGVASAHTMKADSLWVVGADLYAVQGYKIAKLTANADPGISGNYGAFAPVGRPFYPVTRVLPLAGAPIAITAAGVYRFVSPDFITMIEFTSPHPDNGKAAFHDGRGRIYVDTVEGDLIIVQLGINTQQRPVRFTTIDRNTPWGRITAMTSDGEFIYLATEPGQNRTQQIGLTVMSNMAAVWTNHTGLVTDGLFGTGANWSAFANGDAIYVGADEPFWGAYFAMQTARSAGLNAGVPIPWVIEYSAGAGTWTNITASSLDSTAMFARDGAIVPMDPNQTDLYKAGSWVVDTVNGISNKYWLRLRAVAAINFTGVIAAEVWIVPYRPPIQAADQSVAIFPSTGYAVAGALPHILVGQWRQNEIVWHDVWTIHTSRIDQLVVGRASYPGAASKRALYAINWQWVFAMPIGADATPARAPWPNLAAFSSDHMLVCSGFDFGQRVRSTGVGLEIDMPFVQSDDQVWVSYWWDEDSPVYYWLGPESNRYMRIPTALEGSGRVLYVAVAFKQGQRRPVAPYVREVKVPAGSWVAVTDEAYRADAQSPQAT